MPRRSFTHGTEYGWMKKKCTCMECDIAKYLFYAARNAKRRKAVGSVTAYKLPAAHGTPKRYKRGCTCHACRDANNKRKAELRAGKRPSRAVARRNLAQEAMLADIANEAATWREAERQLYYLIRSSHAKGVPVEALAKASGISYGTTKRIALSIGKYSTWYATLETPEQAIEALPGSEQ